MREVLLALQRFHCLCRCLGKEVEAKDRAVQAKVPSSDKSIGTLMSGHSANSKVFKVECDRSPLNMAAKTCSDPYMQMPFLSSGGGASFPS